MIAIDLMCEACGEANPPGTQFCRNCNEFLAWDGAAAKRQPPTGASGTTPPAVSSSAATESTVPIVEQTAPNQAPSEQPAPIQAPWQVTCPYCGVGNPPTRRYCTHCGYSFVVEQGADPNVDWSGWTPHAVAARDREARRAYRRSLPPLYRWRRVIIAVIVFVLFVGVGALVRRDPVALASAAWHRVNDNYVTVAGVQAQVEPAEATAPGSDPQVLVDGTSQEWTMTWAPAGESSCGPASGSGTVIFTFPPTEVRRVVIAPGLAPDNELRPTQPRPKLLGIAFDGGACRTVELPDRDQQQEITVDSGGPVTRMTLGIGSAHSAGTVTPQISLTEVWIQTYPSR